MSVEDDPITWVGSNHKYRAITLTGIPSSNALTGTRRMGFTTTTIPTTTLVPGSADLQMPEELLRVPGRCPPPAAPRRSPPPRLLAWSAARKSLPW
ncbi:hypothetical protein H696_02351 [Fonticula alba]|uniref:Uncharacterized protein n=1 Tax=Fonticula alba TaxID=691883 RepID=A0A058ZBV2_FONAL|nr:hypothetical protein H696_02351 [Fonticula alba]KCV71403.1 hypothetical protein H696_02351 [Fonticula alba]|eukprot:XP_009494526.1 hypothetical protein H696_02351 [Fonticula alba]